ncbi:MAG: hypothetical protein ACJ77K_09355 [Bacteroidia bacterium]|jgi:hypothetical protein
MKTTATLKIILLTAMLASCTRIIAGDRYMSIAVGRDVSGSGLGGNVCPALSFTFGKNTLEGGMNFQRRKMNLSGYQFTYRYAVATSQNEKFELYTSANITYHFSAYMSEANAEIEHSCHKELPDIYSDMKLRVLECHTAIGLKYDPVKCISLGFSAGIGMFDTLNKNYDREMFRDKSAPSLRLRIMVRYNFGR